MTTLSPAAKPGAAAVVIVTAEPDWLAPGGDLAADVAGGLDGGAAPAGGGEGRGVGVGERRRAGHRGDGEGAVVAGHAHARDDDVLARHEAVRGGGGDRHRGA